MATGDLITKYALEDNAPRVIDHESSIPPLSYTASPYAYLFLESRRQAAAKTSSELDIPNNEKGKLYFFLANLWVDTVIGDGIERVELIETTPHYFCSTPVIVINGEHFIYISTTSDRVVPEVLACLFAATSLGPSRYPMPGDEVYDIYGGTMKIEYGDTSTGQSEPIHVTLDRAS